jgi:hypothetical protein
MIDEIPIDKIQVSEWDARQHKEKDKGIEDLMRSIEIDGLLSPVTVNRKDNGYLLIAGRRRLLAFKLLGRNTIAAHVIQPTKTEIEKRRKTFMENHNRSGLTESETAYGILALYESEGYSGEEALSQVKSLYNNGYKIGETNYEEMLSQALRRGDASLPTTRFTKICESIGLSPNSQYQWLQLCTQIDKTVLEEAQKIGLKRSKMTMLTNKLLRKHPKLQIQLARRMAGLSDSDARVLVYQIIRDLETGAIEADGDSYILLDSRRDKLGKNIVLNPVQYYLRLMSTVNKLFYLLSDRAISRGEFKYTKEMMIKTRDHRLSIVKTLDYRSLVVLKQDLSLLQSTTFDTLGMINREIAEREQKEEMIKQ